MTVDPADRAWAGHYLYSPSSSYPTPSATLINASGGIVHTWSNPTDQPPVQDDPPTFLRGWNHVAVDAEGNLFAIVPLRSLLKLDPRSELVWRADVAAHHDIDMTARGEVLVLTETPRLVRVEGRKHLILDNEVTILDAAGTVVRVHSLYDVLRCDLALGALIDEQVVTRYAGFAHAGGPVDAEVRALLETGQHQGSKRRALRLLRQLPGSPCDVLHVNSLRVLDAHPAGLWRAGYVLVSLRNLDLVAVVDLAASDVVWAWGRGVLSGQHQPSALSDGRILVFDNGVAVGRSRLLEVDALTESITWEYLGDPPESFFSALAGGCEMLPNGNVLVTQAQSGRAFEVTRTGRRVWSWELPRPPAGVKTSRVGIYRMSAVPPEVVGKLIATGEPDRREG